MSVRVKKYEVWINTRDNSLWKVEYIENETVGISSLNGTYNFRVLNLNNFLKKYKTNNVTKVLYNN